MNVRLQINAQFKVVCRLPKRVVELRTNFVLQSSFNRVLENRSQKGCHMWS